MNAPFMAPTTAGRWDIYGPIHKGLRKGHAKMLERLGSADFTADIGGLLADLRRHLDLAAVHLEDEEIFIHRALAARLPNGAAALDEQHESHRTRIDELRAAIDAIENGGTSSAAMAGRALYLAFTRYIGEDMAHMAYEEEEVWPVLCSLFDDAELMRIEMEIVANLKPDDAMSFMCLMVPAVNRPERVTLLGGMKQGAPPEAYAAVIESAARPLLPAGDLAALEEAGLL